MRSAQDAVKAAKAHAETGHTYVVDMDIKKFFDRVNHDILMSKIGTVVRDKRVLQIVGRFLRAGVVMPDGLAVSSEEGTPQGGPLCFAALTPAGLPTAGCLAALGSGNDGTAAQDDKRPSVEWECLRSEPK